MAEDNSVGGVYFRLGLSLSELETGFVTASQTVAANISRLNREANLIRLRAEVEIAGLDETADAERILQIRTDALNRQMAIQRDRVRILNAEYQDLVQAHGANSTAAQRAAVRLERERLALANLGRDLRNLNGAQSESNNSFGELNDMLPEIPTKLQAVGIAFGAVTAGIGAAVTATKELLNNFREIQKQSYDLNLPVPETREFLRELRLAGGDIGDFEGYIRGITDAYVKGEYDDPEFVALRKYDAQITDATGRLKNFKEITDELYQAWKKADAAGEGIEFLQLTGGEAGVRDAIQLFKRYEEAKEDAAKIFKVEIDDEELHKLDRTMNLVTEQSDELKNAIGNIFAPAVQAASEKFFQVLHDGTEYIDKNKDAIQDWGFVVSATFETISDKLHELTSYQMPDTGDKNVDKVLDRMQWQQSAFNAQALWGDESPWSKIFSKLPHDIADELGILDRAKEKQKAYNSELDNTKTFADNVGKSIGGLLGAVKENGDVLSQYGSQRVKQFKDELEDLRIELEFGEKTYQKALAELDLWRKRELTNKNFVSSEEKAAIEELYAAKLEQIQQEQLEKTQQYYKDAADIEYNLTHTAFEKQLRDIERWKEAQFDKASTAEEVAGIIKNAAAKEAEAFEAAMDRIKGKLQSLDDKIFAQEHSQYEQDLRRIEQERRRYYDDFGKEGILNAANQAKIERWYQNAVNDLNRRAQTGGDYTKPPEGALQRGGNGIMVIGGDQLIDDGKINQSIGVLVDDSREFAQQLQGLSEDGRKLAIANRQLADAQKVLTQQTQQAASGFQLIEGDKFVNQPATSQSPQPQDSYQVIGGDQVVAEVQQFGDAVQQAQNPLQDFRDSTASAKSALAEAANAFSPDYFKHLAEDTKALSEMQYRLNKSTENLITAQDKLATALNNLPTTEDATRRTGQNQSPDDGMMKLSYRGGDDSRKPYSDIPQQPIAQKSGFKAGFDWDVFGGVGMTAIAGLETLVAIGTIAPHPALKVLGLLGAGGLALAKGSYDATTEASNQSVQARPFAEADLSGLITPVTNIDKTVQSIFTAMQDKQPATLAEIFKPEIFSPLSNLDAPISGVLQAIKDAQSYQTDSLRELFGTLPNIEANTGDILRTLQERGEVPTTDLRAAVDTSTLPTDTAAVDYLTPLAAIDGKLQGVISAIQTKEVAVSFETIVTPLSNIHTVVSNILAAMGKQPPNITVSPNINVNLGGAYVFDNAMKRELVDDCTQQIVDNVEQAVRQATSNSSYGYGA